MSTLGIDLGTKRVGLAISESGVIAAPHSVLRGWSDREDLIHRIVKVAADLQVERFVVGIPRTLRSDQRITAAKFESFANALRQISGKEVILWDEALTTVEATELMRSAGVPVRKQASRIDMEAAAVILQSFLDDQAGRTP